MGEPATLYPEQQEILIALKQLFTAVESEVNKATITPQIFHDILIHLEQTHEHFHRFEFVKILQGKVDEALSGIIELELNKRPNTDPLDVIPEVTDVVFSSAEFQELQDSFCLTMQEVIDVMVEIYHDPIRWEIGTPYVKNRNYHSYDDLSSSSNQTGCMFFTSDQYLQIARNLDPGMPKHIRQNALSCLFKTAPGECEHWPAIRQGIMDGLADEDYNFAEEALSLHAKLFNSGTSYSTGELYTSLSGHLIQHFQSSAICHQKLRNGLDTANKNTRCILRRFMLLSIFQHDIPSFWIRCPERHMIQPITQTVELLSLPPADEGNTLPIHYLALFDHTALWFRKWIHGCFTRNLVIGAMAKSHSVLENAIESMATVVVPDVGSKDVYSSFTYSFRQIKYLEFVHSANLVCNLIQYKAGRELVKAVRGEDGVTDIIKKLINIMCIENTVFAQLDPSLDTQNVASELLREIIISGEECRGVLSNECTVTALLKPLLDLPSYSIKCVQAVCDILAIICSYSVGGNQLINTNVTFQGNEMSAVSVIGQLCRDLMSSPSKVMSKNDKSILSALLFLARQIYTTHEGLAVMIQFNLVSHVNEILSMSGDITPQPRSPPVASDDGEDIDSESCFEEVLIDNMLGFASTPKGLLLLYQDSLLDQCIEYLYQRKCKKLQVSKTQKFGYGYMVSQIASLPSGLQALQRSGFIRQLSQNLWWLLENSGPPTPVEVPVTQPPDPYFEGVVLKATTSLLQVLISYDSLHCILSEAHTLVPLNPDVYRQPEPDSIHDILHRIIFIDTKGQCLMNYDTMQIFGLRILSVLLSCLDTLLYFQDNHDIINFLLKCQEDSKAEDKIVIDESTIERNRILVRSFALGGCGEKVIPPRITNDTISEEYGYELFDTHDLPSCYVMRPSNNAEPRDDVKLSMLLVDNTSDSWLDKTRSFVIAACRKTQFSGHVGLIELVLKYQLQDNTNPFKMIDSQETLDNHATHITGLSYGCSLVVEYGVRLGLLEPATTTADLQQLCQSMSGAIAAQQHSQFIKDTVKFDWFVSVIYLLFGGHVGRSANFLTMFSASLTSAYLWNLRFLNSSFIRSEIASSGVTVIHYKACYCVERVLQKALPMVCSAFRMAGLSPTHVVKRWITTCFLNVLPWIEICNYVLVAVSEGPVYIVLFCVAVLKHIKMRLLEHSTHHKLLYNILEEPISDFVLANYLDYIISLEKQHGHVLRRDLADWENC